MKVLIVAPAFHHYWRGVEHSLGELGFVSTTFQYDANPTPLHAVAKKLAYEIPQRLGHPRERHRSEKATAAAIGRLATEAPDAVLVIKGDYLTPALWEAARTRRIPIVTWQYDELRRTHMGRAGAVGRGPIACFSKGDVAALLAMGVDAHYVPLGFDTSVRGVRSPNTAEITLIGARYPNRASLLKRLAEAGLPVRAYGRDWSAHPIDRARTLSWYRPSIPAHRDVSRAQAYGIMAASPATLNTHSPDSQAPTDGIAMRTFEAAGAGAVQIINRPDVGEFYEPGVEAIVAGTDDEVIEAATRLLKDRPYRARVQAAARERTLREHTLTSRVKTLTELW